MSLAGDRADAPSSDQGRRWALFLPSLAGGGAERVTLNLIRGLLASGHQVDLVLASRSGPYLDLVPEGARVVDLGNRRTLASLPALVRYLRNQKPDGLLSAMNHSNIVAVWAAFLAGYRGPVLVAEHNELPASDHSRWQRAFNAAIRFSYPRAKQVIAVSHGVKRSLVNHAGVPADRIEVIYNPVIHADFSSQNRQLPPELQTRTKPVIVGVGRLTRQKNFVNLLQAFALLRARLDARLLILGEGEDRPLLAELVARLGLADDVSMPGFVSNPYDFLAHADLFVLSSDWEGLPTVLIEALALGTRVVSTDCPSGPREILANGHYGALVPMGDSEALADAMVVALHGDPPTVPASWLEQFTEAEATRFYVQAFGLDRQGALDAPG